MKVEGWWKANAAAFKPGKCGCCCDEIAFVQIIKVKERIPGFYGVTKKEYGWVLDGALPYLGTTRVDPCKGKTVGMSDEPSRGQWLQSYSYWGFVAEACVVCMSGKEGPGTNSYITYGCFQWGFEYSASPESSQVSYYFRVNTGPTNSWWVEAFDKPVFNL